MSESAAVCCPPPPAWVLEAINDPAAFTMDIDQLLENFGAEDVANAGSQEYLQAFSESLKEMINDSDLPQYIKDMAIATIDQHMADLESEMPCSNECQDAVSQSDLGAETSRCGTQDAQTACGVETEEPPHEHESDESHGSCGSAGTSGAHEHGDHAESSAAGGGGSSAGESAASGSASSSGGASGASHTYEDTAGQLAADAGRPTGNEDEEGGQVGAGNWLVALARSLAEIQSKFLDEALKQSNVMAGQAGNAGEGKSAKFLEAQALYTANMQLFNIFSQQVSTSIKTIGESLSAIARKQ